MVEVRDGAEHAYLTDFGLARVATTTGVGPTRTGEVVGTADYLAPEQIKGDRVDARSDMYALGCVLFECLAGRPPFARDTDVAKLWAHVNEPPPSLASERPDVTATFDEVVARALAKDPAGRYPSAGDLGRAAVAAATGSLVFEPERVVARGEAAAGVGAVASRGSRWRRLRTPLVIGGAVLVAGIVAGVLAATGVFGGSERGTAESPPAPAPASPASTPAEPAETPPVSTGEETIPVEPPVEGTPGVGQPIELEGTPSDIAVTGESVWVTTEEGDLYEIDPAREAVVAAPVKIDIRSGFLVGVDYDALHDVLWLVKLDRGGNGALVRLDPATKQTVGTEVPLGENPSAQGFAGEFAWVLNSGDFQNPEARSTLLKLDRATGTPVGKPMDLGQAGLFDMAIAVEDIWLTDPGRHRVLRFDLASERLVGKPVAVDGFPVWVEMVDDDPWFSYDGIESVGRIDPERQRVVGSLLTIGGAPFSMAADGNGVWVAGAIMNEVSWVDPDTYQVVATIPVSEDPGPIAAGEGAVWVGSHKNDTITRIDPAEVVLAPGQPGTAEDPGTLPFAGRLAPGTYRGGEFQPTFSFTVEAGWVATRSAPDFWGINLDRVRTPSVSMVVVSQVFGPGGSLEPAPDDLIAWLRARPGVDVSPPSPIRMGELEGVQVDVVLTDGPDDYPRECDRPCIDLIAFGDRGVYGLSEDQPVRIVVVDVDGTEVTAVVEARSAKELEWFAPRAEEVLRSVRFD
jgi:serine/threonine-protein kinase